MPPSGSKIFLPQRCLGYVSNHIPLQVRYIKSRNENLIVTCVGKSFHTYGISHFGLLSVGGLHPENITCMTSDSFHVYTSCKNNIYAWRRGTELKHVYRGHTKPVHLMVPFGVHLISIDESSHVNVWDIKAEEVFLELNFSNDSFKITTVLHPSTYINKILFGSEQGEMQLWNINTSKLIYAFKGWEKSISCLEQAPALDVVAVGLASGRIILHNLRYDETVMEFHQDYGLVTAISFRTDGHPVMATGSVAGHVVFWDLEERRVASQLLAAHDGPVTGMVCLPNEPLVLTSSPDNTLKLWIFDLSDGGARLLRIREGHSMPPTYVRHHGANGHNILSASPDSTLRIFNTQTEQFNKSLGRASYNRKASKKRKRTEDDPLRMPPIVQFTSETTREKEWDNIAAIHAGICQVTTWSYDRLKMGDLKLVPERFQNRNMGGAAYGEVSATSLCLTHCGNFVVIGYSTGHVDRFNMQSGIWQNAYGKPKAHENAVRGVATDSLNQIVISGSSDCTIKFWRFKNKGSPPLTVLNIDEPVSFMRTHHESAMLAVALENFDVHILDMDTRRIVRKFVGHRAQLTDATFSPDSRWLVTSSMDRTIRTWNIPSSQLVDQFATDMPCVSLSMSPAGDTLATAHVDSLGIFLWVNRTLYAKISLKSISPSDEAPLVSLPDYLNENQEEEEQKQFEEAEDDEWEFISPEQISADLITLSGLSSSRWQNLLDIDIIRKRNKPKEPIKKPKSAPFFLPTVSTLSSFEFDLKEGDTGQNDSRLLAPANIVNLSKFGKLLLKTQTDQNYDAVVEKLKSYGPTLIDFEIKSLAPDAGGSVEVMLQFLRSIDYMLGTNKNFELAQSYLGVFLKEHGSVIAVEESLCAELVKIRNSHEVKWKQIRDKFMYNVCVVQLLKEL